MPTYTKLMHSFEEIWIDPKLVYHIAGAYRLKCVNSRNFTRNFELHDIKLFNSDPRIRNEYIASLIRTPSFIHKYEFRARLSPIKQLIVLVASRYELTPVTRDYDNKNEKEKDES